MTIKTILACVTLSMLSITILNCKPNPKKIEKTAKVPKVKAEKLKFPHHGTLLKNMTESQLEDVLVYGKKVKDQELIFKTFFYLISQSKSQENIKKYKIDFADYSFGIEDYTKASMAYEEFGILYPGSAEAEYAQYKAILCSFLLSLSFDRDQTRTQQTLSMSILFLQKAKDEKFIEETKRIYASCRRRLFDHEVYVLETYLKLFKSKSALKRIEHIEKEFIDIEHQPEYVAYFKDMVEMVKNIKTRPFIIELNLKHALLKKEERPTASSIRRLTSFFLA